MADQAYSSNHSILALDRSYHSAACKFLHGRACSNDENESDLSPRDRHRLYKLTQSDGDVLAVEGETGHIMI